MSEPLMKPPPPGIFNVNANPAVCTAIAVSDWFVKPPAADKFTPRAGNSIALLDCGEEYLPAFYAAVRGAQKSIWIAIWGFDPDLPLVLDSRDEQHRISAVLTERADAGVKVKILVWYNVIANTKNRLSDDESHQDAPFSWSERQRSLFFHHTNIQYKVRDMPLGAGEARRQLHSDRLKYRGGDSWTIMEELFSTHHQKMILIDHSLGKDATGFVQGINFWPKYFDYKSHPWREGGNRIQDVGLALKGPCLIDLFHNFKESWNDTVDVRNMGTFSDIDEGTPAIPSMGTYSAQILRTWRKSSEFGIHDFYYNALYRNLNHFIYVEDQYFRMPEFANAIKARAKAIRDKSRNGKRLHLFVLTNPIDAAKGEAEVRQQMLQHLNRGDADLTEAQATQRYKQGDVVDQQAIEDMEKSGVMVHVCCLKNHATQSVRGRMTGETYNSSMHIPLPTYEWSNQIVYADVYVHAKLTIFDDAYLTLGSANWNGRSMKTDSELNIAVQCTDDKATDFREKLWREHTNGQWQPAQNAQGCFDVEGWFRQWTDLLSDNMMAYSLKQPLTMNLFPLFEDLEELKKSTGQRFG